MFSDLMFRVRSLFRAQAAEDELDDELRFHAEQQREKFIQSGLTLDEATRRVRLEFGGLDQVKEECREARGVSLMETLLQDVRYALRTLRKAPGFTAVAMLTLALGIGANTAIFSIVDGVLLRPLPYQDPSRLIALNETTPKVGTVSVSYPDFLDWRAQSRSFSDMAAVCAVEFNLAGINQPENISGEAVSPNFLSLLGVRPVLGRDFDAAEGKAGTAPVVLLSYQLWQSKFGGDHNALGRIISLDGRGFTIIGVLPPDFRSTDKTDVMEPIGVWLTNNSSAAERGDRGDMVVIATARGRRRLRTGPRGNGRNRGAARTGVPWHQRPVRGGLAAHSRSVRQRYSSRASRPVWRRRVCPADRLRQRRESFSDARSGPDQGNCAAHRPRRQPRTHHPSDAGGEFRPGDFSAAS